MKYSAKAMRNLRRRLETLERYFGRLGDVKTVQKIQGMRNDLSIRRLTKEAKTNINPPSLPSDPKIKKRVLEKTKERQLNYVKDKLNKTIVESQQLLANAPTKYGERQRRLFRANENNIYRQAYLIGILDTSDYQRKGQIEAGVIAGLEKKLGVPRGSLSLGDVVSWFASNQEEILKEIREKSSSQYTDIDYFESIRLR